MRSSSDKTGITWLLILVLLPWLIDYWHNGEQLRQDRRNEELYARYGCHFSKCVTDFDGDGSPARLKVIPCESSHYGCLIALEGGREILRLKYDGRDDTLRTHLAVSKESGGPRLLIYDGASYSVPLKLAFAWDGEQLSAATPSGFEREIIDAMAAHYYTGGWNERTVFRDFIRYLRFTAYYMLLLFLICVLSFGKYKEAKGNPHFKAPHFLCRRPSP